MHRVYNNNLGSLQSLSRPTQHVCKVWVKRPQPVCNVWVERPKLCASCIAGQPKTLTYPPIWCILYIEFLSDYSVFIGFELVFFHFYLLGSKLLAMTIVILFSSCMFKFKMKAPSASLPQTCFHRLPRRSSSLAMVLGLPIFWRKHRPHLLFATALSIT